MTGIWKRIREGWMNYLDRLARANEKNFGNRRLDCCGLNARKKNSDSVHT